MTVPTSARGGTGGPSEGHGGPPSGHPVPPRFLSGTGPGDPTGPGPRAAAYLRVSTRRDQSTEAQLAIVRSAALAQGWHLPEERVFRDEGVSGRLLERPAFDMLRGEIRARNVDVVLAVRLDRLGRSVRGILDFFDEAAANGVRVVITSQAIDTATPIGRFVRTILAGAAELEGETIRERTREKMELLVDHHMKTGEWKTKSGRPVGRPRRVTPELVSKAGLLRRQGLPWAAVAQRVGLPAETCRRAVYESRKAGGGV